MKKIISLLMAAIFVFSMAVPSFAAASVNDVAQPAAISSSDATGTDDILSDVVDFFTGVFESIVNFFKWLFGISFDAAKYDVTYYWDSSKVAVYDKRSYEVGSSLGSVPVPQKTGYTFIGWYPELPAEMPAQDLEVYATWSVQKFVITFNTNGGTPIAAMAVAYGDPIVLPAAPTKDGCSFLGWDATYATMPANNITLNAIWGEKHTSINFDTDGGSKIPSIVQPIGATVTRPQNPTKPGYTFLGWNGVIPTYQPEENVTFIARWKPNTYTVKWVVEGSVKSTNSYDCGALVTCPVAAFKDGYDFDRWVDEDGNAYVSGETVMAPHNVTYTAVFKAKAYDYTFVSDGETVGEGNVNADTVLTVTNPEKTGYTFKGWKDNYGTTYAVGAVITMPAKNVVFTAIWEANKYNAVFNIDGTQVTVPTDYDTVPVIADPEKTGYSFIGWEPALAKMGTEGAEYTAKFEPTGDTAYTVKTFYMNVNGEGYTAETETLKGNADSTITITPEAKAGFVFNETAANVLSATIKADGSTEFVLYYVREKYTCTINGVEQELYYGEQITAPAEDAVKVGSTFKGWRGSDGELYASGDAITIPADGFTLTPEFEAVVYTITYYYTADGSASTIPGAYTEWAKKEYKYGDAIAAISNPEITNKYFEGWSQTIGSAAAEALPETMPANNVVCYAVFSENVTKLTVTFDADEGEFPDGTANIGPMELLRGQDINLPSKDPVLENKGFAGWALTKDATEPITVDKMTYDKDTTFYAVYVDITCEVEFTYLDAEGNLQTKETKVYNLGETVDVDAAMDEVHGYTFSGWYIDKVNGEDAERDENGERKPAESFVVTAEEYSREYKYSRVYYGEYVLNEHDVVFDGNGGTWGEETQQISKTGYGEEIELPEDPTAPEGMAFVGWRAADDEEAEKIYASGESVGTLVDESEDYTADKEYGFVAVYVVDNFVINYMFDGEVVHTEKLSFGNAIPAYTLENLETGLLFEGWAPFNPNDEEAEPTVIDLAFIELMDEITDETGTANGYAYKLQAVIDHETYYISFVGCYKDAIPVKYTYDIDAAAVNAAPEARTGYKFNGWLDAEGKAAEIPETMPAHDISLYADWELEKYTVIFDGNGGDWKNAEDATLPAETVKNVEVNFGENVVMPADPAREGYTFDGWDTEIPAPMTDIGETGATMTVEAKWTVNSYSITWDVDGKTTVKEYDFGTHVDKPEPPVKTGYTFDGWDGWEKYDSEDGSVLVMPSLDITLTAKWEVNEYVITFVDADDETIVYETITQDYGTDVTEPEDPEKEGHTFKEWDTAIPKTMPAGNLTIKAVWTVNEYPVSFKASDAEDAASIDVNIAYGTEISEKVPADFAGSAAGKYIIGWVTEPDSDEPVELGTMPALGEDEVLTYYAVWADEEYTLTVDCNGGEWLIRDEEGNVTGTNGTEETIEGNYGKAINEFAVPEREGYTFIGWSEEIPAEMPDLGADGAEKTITAQWQANIYKAVFDADNGSWGEETEKEFGVACDADVELPAEPSRKGYTFDGWSGYDYENGETMPAGDKTYIALWKANDYTVTFKLGYDNKEVVKTVKFDSTIIKPEDPAREGYTFGGWEPALADNTVLTDAEDKVYTAKWIALGSTKYTVETYIMDTDETYVMTSEIKEGVTDTQATAEYTVETGFELNTEKSVLTGPVAADNSLVLKVYLDRISYTLSTDVDGVVTEIGKYRYGSMISIDSPEKKAGYTEHWEGYPEDGTMPAENLTLVAVWTPITYKIIFANAGYMDAVELKCGEAIDASKFVPEEKTGYDFAGWYDGEEKYVFPETMPANNIEVTAKWTAKSYKVTFDANGGAWEDAAATKVVSTEYGKMIETPKAPVLEGKTLKGWSTTKNGQVVDSLGTMAAADKTFYAVWE